MTTHQIKVHQDELEYTADGLRTRPGSSLSLSVGNHNVVRIIRPKRVRLLGPGVNGFAFNSSFPTPGVLQLFLVPELRAELEKAIVDGGHYARVFGHTDATGDAGANKHVSERRAQAMLALLTSNPEIFAGLAKKESWGVGEAQVMLRALRCDPGPPDGEAGPLTRRALEVFQNQFNAGMFHRHLDADAPNAIPVTADFDRATLDALIDSFVTTISPHICETRLHPTHPTAGCSEFNAFGETARANRRVSVALYPQLPPHHDKAPCQTGNHTVCPVQPGQKSGCLWYREHFIERTEESVVQRHFDLRWLFLAEDRVLLSALTTAEDGSAIEFRVYRSPEIEALDDLSLDRPGEPLSEPITGTVLNGVAYCEWSFSAEQAEQFRSERWLTPIPFDRAREQDLPATTPTACVPVFTISGSGAQTLSLPPLYDVCRCVLEHDDASGDARYIWMVDSLGRVHHALFGKRAVETESRALATSVHAAVLPLT